MEIDVIRSTKVEFMIVVTYQGLKTCPLYVFDLNESFPQGVDVHDVVQREALEGQSREASAVPSKFDVGELGSVDFEQLSELLDSRKGSFMLLLG